jgi:glutamate/tyrosine decarboxylase-like PLP-dependent enzyme
VFNEDLIFYVNYLGGEAPTATLNFSKRSATVLMQYYMFLRFGRSGYTQIMRYALDHAIYLRDRLSRSGKFQIMDRTQWIPGLRPTVAVPRQQEPCLTIQSLKKYSGQFLLQRRQLNFHELIWFNAR